MEVFSTEGVAGPNQAERWNAILSRFGDAIQIWPHDPLRFDGTLIRLGVGRLTLFEVRCGSVRIRHTRRPATQAKGPSYQLLMPLQGSFSFTHGHRPAAMVGEGALCLIDRREPYEMEHGDGLRAFGIEFPRSMLESHLPEAAHFAGSVLQPFSAPSRVLSGLMRALGAELSRKDNPLPSGMARCIGGFVAAAFADQRKPALRRGMIARLKTYREYVEARQDDSDFRPQDIAREFHVSERYVRMVFQSAGEPLSALLLRLRLERAAKLLRNPKYADLTLMRVALDCGFNCASHFGHCFRERYGVTPRNYRRAGPSSAAAQ